MPGNVTSPVRSRLLQAASELFYAEGVRAVSVDKIIERAGTTKVTFYRYFTSKDELVVAYLLGAAAQEREAVEAAIARADGDVRTALGHIAQLLGQLACRPGFRGCAFINAAAEYPDPDDPVRKAVDAHREWYEATFERLVEPLGLPEPAAVAEDLMLLRDGAMVAGYLGESEAVAASFLRSSRAVVGTGA